MQITIRRPAAHPRSGSSATGDSSAAIELVARWLAGDKAERASLPELFDGFCGHLLASGLPIVRVTLGLETLHPVQSGVLLRWQDGRIERNPAQRAGVLASDAYRFSPTRVVDETDRPFRWRAGEDQQGMPLLEELAADGFTDYLMLPLPFLDDSRTANASFATRVAGGFSPRATDELAAATRLLSPLAERVVLRTIAVDLLAAYLGGEAARRVYEGQIERGDVRTLLAALLFCDLRGFTALSDRVPRTRLVGILNRWYEVLGDAIAAGGGEILKFMGDGLLAAFPVTGGPAATCTAALRAAETALAGTERLNEALLAEGEAPLRFGTALHLGEVEFGNVGTPSRLDFTVIGPAVNLASRLQGLTKELDQPLVASEMFATASALPLRLLGAFPLRGIAEPVPAYAPLTVNG